jgi:hypothetical protein
MRTNPILVGVLGVIAGAGLVAGGVSGAFGSATRGQSALQGVPRPAPTGGPALLTTRRATPKGRVARPLAGTTLLEESFAGSSTSAGAWSAASDACLTAGTASTPSTSIPACGKSYPQDPSGQGALQLATNSGYHVGMVVYQTPLSTANGLVITFNQFAFSGSDADGMTVFLSDASQAIPTTPGGVGGSLGYANGGPNGPGSRCPA